MPDFAFSAVVNVKTSGLWSMTGLCSVKDGYQFLGGTCCFQLNGNRWRQQVCPKCWYPSTSITLASRTWNLRGNSGSFSLICHMDWCALLCFICHSVWCVFIFTHMQVVGIMRVNVEKVLERDQKLSELDNRAGELKWYCKLYCMASWLACAALSWLTMPSVLCRLWDLAMADIVSIKTAVVQKLRFMFWNITHFSRSWQWFVETFFFGALAFSVYVKIMH